MLSRHCGELAQSWRGEEEKEARERVGEVGGGGGGGGVGEELCHTKASAGLVLALPVVTANHCQQCEAIRIDAKNKSETCRWYIFCILLLFELMLIFPAEQNFKTFMANSLHFS